MVKESGFQQVMFAPLWEGGTMASLDEEHGIVCFPQNFTPTQDVPYEVNVVITATGSYKFNGKDFRVARAYDPSFDIEGVPIGKSASVMDKVEHSMKSDKERRGLNTLAGQLQAIKKDKLPKQKIPMNAPIDRTPPELKIGDRVVRAVRFMTDGTKELCPLPLHYTDKGSAMFRVAYGTGCFTKHWVLLPHDNKGMICFVNNHKFPPKTTVIGGVVQGFSKEKNVVFITPEFGTLADIEPFYDFPEV